jgi:hypothetical protein
VSEKMDGNDGAPPADPGGAELKSLEAKEPRLSFRELMTPRDMADEITLVVDRRKNAYIAVGDSKTLVALRSPKAEALLLRCAAQKGNLLRPMELREWIDRLAACAQLAAETRDVWLRVARIPGGAEIDLGDELGTRARLIGGQVEILTGGSETLFYRTPMMGSFAMPAAIGNLELLYPYLNLSPSDRVLLIAWLSYALAHPKLTGVAFPLLVLIGGQGCGKTFLCRLIQSLCDPSNVGVQTFPATEQELAVSVQLAHVTVYDNVRCIRPALADALCRVASGGALVKRRLFTDSDTVTLSLHGAVVLNGIYAFIDQPDLAQRCLPLTLLPLDEKCRRSEGELNRDFQRDLPQIFRGLLDLTAGALAHVDAVTPTSPERMIDFVRWLAAIERFQGIPGDPFQTAYGDALKQGMRDSLEENPLAAAILELIDEAPKGHWSGTPSELLDALNQGARGRTPYLPEWPRNAIALSKRLKPIVPALRQQAVEVRFERGADRRITIVRVEGVQP